MKPLFERRHWEVSGAQKKAIMPLNLLPSLQSSHYLQLQNDTNIHNPFVDVHKNNETGYL